VLNIGSNDNIIVLFPDQNRNNNDEAKLKANGKNTIDTQDVGLLGLSSGNETIKINTDLVNNV